MRGRLNPCPRLRARHDYTMQWDGHRVIRAATGPTAYVTGDDIRQHDILVLPDGDYEVAASVGHADSDLFLVELRARS